MLTVVLCSHNGAPTIGRALEALAGVVVPVPTWRVVVVDNASSDGTAAIASGFADRLPLRVVAEPRRGKSAAMNRGLGNAAGDLVAFMDDDVLPEPGCLQALWECATAHPGAAALAGRIVGAWPRPPDPWMTAWLAGGHPLLGLSNPGWAEGACPPWYVKGGNMAIRPGLAGSGFRFDETMGMDGVSNALMGEETDAIYRLRVAGREIRYCPAAVAAHIIRPHQMTKTSLLARAMRHGRSDLHLGLRYGGGSLDVPAFLGYPRHMIRKLAGLAARRIASLATGDELARFEAHWNLAYHRGLMDEARRMRLASRPAAG